MPRRLKKRSNYAILFLSLSKSRVTFLKIAVVLYYLFPKRLRQYVLLAASILFYLTYGVRMAGYLAATILLTYLFGL